jgi:hypothetical protein
LFYLLLTLHVSTPVLGHHQAHDEYMMNDAIQLTKACIHQAPDDDPKQGSKHVA